MSGRALAIVTTRLPPAACGIGTYSWLLRKHWPNKSSSVEFLVLDGAAAAGTLTSDRVTEFHGRGVELARALDRIGAADVLLHYAGRAYQRFGFPAWMPGVLARWKRRFQGARLMIVVHEVPADFPITSRHYWLGRLSSWVVSRLATIADVLVTNTEHHVTKLRQLSDRADIHLVPVGSNIEPTDVATSLRDVREETFHGTPDPHGPQGPWLQPRTRTEFVVFGLPFGRLQTLQLFDSQIRRWQVAGRLTKLHLIGPEDDKFARQADELVRLWPDPNVIVRHGLLPSMEVARLLRRAQFALSNVTEQTWSKSGAFMACAVNRCAIVIDAAAHTSGPLSHALRSEELEKISEDEITRRTAALAAWYHENADWRVTAPRLASLLATGETGL